LVTTVSKRVLVACMFAMLAVGLGSEHL
jgi:hypothetical protein